MTFFLYKIVELIALIHNYILTLNDVFEYSFGDKALHFLVIGILGMLLILLVYPIFKFLATRNHILTITCIFVLSQVIVITFAIEIGQKITNTGNMEFADIVYGIAGFITMYLVFNIFRAIIVFIKKLIKKRKK